MEQIAPESDDPVTASISAADHVSSASPALLWSSARIQMVFLLRGQRSEEVTPGLPVAIDLMRLDDIPYFERPAFCSRFRAR